MDARTRLAGWRPAPEMTAAPPRHRPGPLLPTPGSDQADRDPEATVDPPPVGPIRGKAPRAPTALRWTGVPRPLPPTKTL